MKTKTYSETHNGGQICIETTRHGHCMTYEAQYNHSSHTAAFALSSSSFLFASSSLSRFRRRISCSFIARSYARCSSVLFGARIPSAPAISLPATAVCFSGLLAGDLDPDPRGGDELNQRPGKGALDTQGWDVCGEMGVGGGSSGPSAARLTEGESGEGSGVAADEERLCSISDREGSESASSSHESATTGAFFLVEGVFTIGRGMSLMGALSRRESWRTDCSSSGLAAGIDIGGLVWFEVFRQGRGVESTEYVVDSAFRRESDLQWRIYTDPGISGWILRPCQPVLNHQIYTSLYIFDVGSRWTFETQRAESRMQILIALSPPTEQWNNNEWRQSWS